MSAKEYIEPCPVAPVVDDPEWPTRVHVPGAVAFPDPVRPGLCADGVWRELWFVGGIGLCWYDAERAEWRYRRNPKLHPAYALREEYRRRDGR